MNFDDMDWKRIPYEASYRVVWGPDEWEEVFSVGSIDALYHVLYDRIERGATPEGLTYPIRVQEDPDVPDGRGWLFDRKAFTGHKRETIGGLESLGHVRRTNQTGYGKGTP